MNYEFLSLIKNEHTLLFFDGKRFPVQPQSFNIYIQTDINKPLSNIDHFYKLLILKQESNITNFRLAYTSTEYLVYFHKESRHIIKSFLQDKQKEINISSKDINEHLGKASNGGGTWSSIAGKKKLDIQYPTKVDWEKLEELFGNFNINYDDYVYKFKLETGVTDVWKDIDFYDRTYEKMHPTQKPYKLIERLINCSTDENDIVLDPFIGSGMTALVCKNKKRNFYGCELSKEYYKKSLI